MQFEKSRVEETQNSKTHYFGGKTTTRGGNGNGRNG